MHTEVAGVVKKAASHPFFGQLCLMELGHFVGQHSPKTSRARFLLQQREHLKLYLELYFDFKFWIQTRKRLEGMLT